MSELNTVKTKVKVVISLPFVRMGAAYFFLFGFGSSFQGPKIFIDGS